ncbi:MAG: Ig-like domain-containing protein [Muribaculaceae bacterium]|nr:Ig-like domain-containing protein [Muribaculaceae bacterium]
MRQKLLSILLLLSIVAPFAALADSFYISPANLELGKTATLQLNLDNTQDYYGFQAEVKLPAGIVAVKNGDNLDFTLSNRAAGGSFEVNSNVLSNGNLIMGAFSTTKTSFTGNSGALVNLTVSVTESYKGGEIKLVNVLFIDKENKDVKFADTSMTPTIAVSEVTFKRTSLTLNVGQNTTFVATIHPDEATDKAVTWASSDPTIATVDDKGYVEAIAAGTTNITATSANGAKATCVLKVNAVAVTGVSLDKTELNLTEGDKATLTASVLPENATNKTLTWSSDHKEVATVSSNGEVTAVGEGTAIITVSSANGKEATCTVTVAKKIIAATAIALSATTTDLKVNGTVTLTATVTPDNATDKTVTWTTSDAAIATVDANGKVTAKALGEATITAACGNVTATCKVTVSPTEVTGISFTRKTLTMEVGDKTETPLTPNFTPANATDKTVTWKSSDESVATVSEGMVTAVGVGTANITATTTNGKVATCQVTVHESVVEVTSISISKAELSLTEGDKAALTATVLPADATDASVEWSSSDEEVATVSENGEVTAVGPGTATITAESSNGKKATCVVTVAAKIIEATAIELSATTAELKVNGTVTLTATVTPDNTTDKTVTWASSDEAIATVDATGKVTAKAIGEATITATCGSVKAECAVKVVATPVESIELNLTELTLTEGDKSTLKVTYTPGSATDKTVTWTSSDDSVATVATTGEVTAVKAGTASITATTANGKTASCTVTVEAKEIPVASITLNDTELSLLIGKTATLTATINPEDATDKTVEWTSSNPKVATVSGEGVVTAKTVGTATITAATNNDKSATCTVTVLPIPVESLSILDEDDNVLDSTHSLALHVGDEYTLTEVVTPENATEQKVTWTSSNETVATIVDIVEEPHQVHIDAIGVGEATITASLAGFTTSFKVTVAAPEVEVTGITLDKKTAEMETGASLQLNATITPENATSKEVKWTSSDSNIATVSTKGLVTAKKAGKVTITATANKYTATCVITITDPVVAVESVTLDKTESTLEVGKTVTLTATVAPADATDKTVTWTSSDDAVATVKDGVVTAVAEGTAIITAKAGEMTATCTITVKAGEPVIPDDPDKDKTRVPVKMTYVNMDEPDQAYGEIAEGETAEAGFNKINGGTVGFGNTGWGVNYITYLQVNVSEIEGTILNATLSFDASGSTDSKRNTGWGAGYNSSVWSSDMTYNTADKSITTVGEQAWTTSKSATTFDNLSIDITEAVLNAENGVATILIYETNAGGGYIKNPVVKVQWTDAETYDVTFKETNDVEATVIVNTLDVTNGTSLPDGTYSFTATAAGYKDYSGQFTVAGAPLEVEFTMTPKATWSWTLKNNVNQDLVTGTCLEGESVSAPYSRYILAADGTVWMKEAINKDYHYTFTPDSDNYEATLEYSATETTDGIFFAEAENIEGMTTVTGANANIRCSNAAGGYSAEPVAIYTLPAGSYKVTIGVWGNAGANFTVKAGEETILTAATQGWWFEASEEFTLAAETTLTFEGAEENKPLDYVLITRTENSSIEVESITLSETEVTILEGEEFTLVATVNPADADDAEVEWTSSDESIASVDENGNVRAWETGEVTITAAAGGKTATCKVIVTKTTGVAALGFDSNAPVKVYDLNGRYISDKVEGLEGGIYVIRQGNKAKKVQLR